MDTSTSIYHMLLLCALTGSGGLALGAALGIVMPKTNKRMLSLLLRFTSGVILCLVCFDLIPDALEYSGSLIPLLLGLPAGYVCTWLLNRSHSHRHLHSHRHSKPPKDKPVKSSEEAANLRSAGLVLAAAVALHNMPIGITVGVSYAAAGSLLSLLIIGLHNLPEGMSIAIPLLADGSRPVYAIGIAALSGLPTVLGAWLGYTVGGISSLLLEPALAFAAGAMFYVILAELLPQAQRLYRHKLAGLALLVGLLLGLALIYRSLGHIGHIH